jgi:transposase InsO family protein
MTNREVIEFITEHIIHRFGFPQTLTTDQGTSFMSKEVKDFAESYKIKMLNLSPYYAQVNGQAESTDKILIKLVKKRSKWYVKIHICWRQCKVIVSQEQLTGGA